MKRAAILALIAMALAGCAKRTTVAKAPPPPVPSANRPVPKTGIAPTIGDLYGYASWYGYPYHGRKTASGEVYDMNSLTAAHKTLALGTWVEVTNQDNGQKVEVRINDRGPFIEGRVIDLSYAAAKQVQMIGPGVALVRLRILDAAVKSPPVATVRYGVQVAAFHEPSNAARLQEILLQKHTPVQIAQSGDLYKVMVGAEASEAAAQSLAAQLRMENLATTVVVLP